MSGNSQRSAGAKKAAAAAFNAPGGPASLCKQAVIGRYPFTAEPPNGIPLDDFGRLFAPNGMINTFFNTQLRPFVDTSGATWKAQAVAGVAPPVSPATWRSSSAPRPSASCSSPVAGRRPACGSTSRRETLDRGAKQVTLELGGQVDQLRPWPAASQRRSPGPGTGMDSARAGVRSAAVRRTARAVGERALGVVPPVRSRARCKQAGSSDRYTLTFHVGDREASFEIRAGSVLNPFAPGMLHDFRCPGL